MVTGIRPHARFLGRPATKNNKLIELLQGAEQLEDEPMAPIKRSLDEEQSRQPRPQALTL